MIIRYKDIAKIYLYVMVCYSCTISNELVT